MKKLLLISNNPVSIISLLWFMLSINLTGQIRGTISDKSTGQPVPFANVFIKEKPIGATTDLNGNFEIKSVKGNDILVISAIGYETLQVNSEIGSINIQLVPKTYQIPDIIVKPSKKKKITIESYNSNKITNYFACGGYPWIVTKFFEYRKEYNSTPHLDRIKILTSTSSSNAVIFNLRLISVLEDGTPGQDLLDKNLIIKAQPGVNKNTIIDLSSYNLTFPQSGFIMAVEWLILDQNKSDWKGGIQFLPQFGSVIKDGDRQTWNYVGGKWLRTSLLPPTIKNKYSELAAELTLTN